MSGRHDAAITTATKEQLKKLIDAPPDDAAEELEMVLLEMLEDPEYRDWRKPSTIQLGSGSRHVSTAQSLNG